MKISYRALALAALFAALPLLASGQPPGTNGGGGGGGSANPGGVDKQLQFNSAGSFAGITNGSAGTCLLSNGAGSTPSFGSCASSVTFNGITNGTNTTAAMVVGPGGSLTTSGSGSITASALAAGIALGTPASGTLTNATGLPIATGVSGLGTGVGTFLATPSSANLFSAVTDETGSGALVGATSPTLVTPALGTPTSGVMTNVTGLPVATGISGLGSGIATFLATPTSANLASAITNETGSGALMFATSPTVSTGLTLGYITGSTQCLHVNTSGVLTGTGSDCGAGGSTAFSGLTGSTNSTAAMVVGSGASLTTSGSGTINANQVNGAVVPTSAALLASDGSATLQALTLGGNLAVNSGVLQTSQAINAQTGTTYAMQTSDAGKLVTLSNASSIAISLSSAATTGFTAGYSFDIENLGAGTATITPATSSINGVSTLTLSPKTGCTVTSDGSNYQVSACSALLLPALPSGTTATTQSAGDNTTKIATDAYVNSIFAAPPAIGGTTPASGAFTTLSGSTISGTGQETINLTGQTANTNIVTALLENTTAATSGNQQIACAQLDGRGWGTTAATSQQASWLICNTPTQAAVPTSTLTFAWGVNGGAYGTPNLTINSNGSISSGGGGTATFTGALNVNGTGASTGINKPSTNTIGFSAGGSAVGTWSVAAGLAGQAFTSSGTKFTAAGTGCTVGATTGGAAAGTFALAAGPCTSVAVTINGATGLTAPTGWTCQAHDRTAPTVLIGGESSSTTTTATFTIPAGAGTTDVISFSCTGF